jgi:hypothetical protein
LILLPRFGSRPEGGAITSHVRSHRPAQRLAVTSTWSPRDPPLGHASRAAASGPLPVTKDTDTEPASTEAGTTEKTLSPTDRLNENSRVMNSSRPWAQAAAIDGELRFGNGFTTAEHPDILRLFSTLGIPLAHYTAAGTQLQLSVQNRDRPGQLTTLGCWIVGWSHLAATSTKKDLTGALIEVRDDLHRQIDAKTAADRERRNCAAAQVRPTPITPPTRVREQTPRRFPPATARQETTVSRPTTRPDRGHGKLNWRRKESPTMGGCGPHWPVLWSPTKNGVTARTQHPCPRPAPVDIGAGQGGTVTGAPGSSPQRRSSLVSGHSSSNC